MTKRERFQKYMQTQKAEMEKHKWIESEKAGKDLGEACIHDWIRKYAKKFRKEFLQKDLRKAKEELMCLEKTDKTRALIEDIQEKLEEIEDMI